MLQTKRKKGGVTIAAVAAAVFPAPSPAGPKTLAVAPITENSPGVKLRRAHDLYVKAVSR